MIPFFGAPIQYARALKTLMWDYRSASAVLEQLTGIPILGASTAAAGFLVGNAVHMALSPRFASSVFFANSARAIEIEEDFS